MGPIDVEVDPERLKAGEAYLKALRSLGLDPEGLFWAWDMVEAHFILMLVTRYFDIVGPTAVSRLLFRAYNLAATPAEIDPFIIRLHSPDHDMIRGMMGALDSFKAQVIDKGRVKPDTDLATAHIGNDSVAVPLGPIYVWKDVRRPGVDLLRKWGFIERKVDSLAA